MLSWFSPCVWRIFESFLWGTCPRKRLKIRFVFSEKWVNVLEQDIVRHQPWCLVKQNIPLLLLVRVPIDWHPLCVQLPSKHIYEVISTSCPPCEVGTGFSPFYRGQNWGSEKMSDLPCVPQPTAGRPWKPPLNCQASAWPQPLWPCPLQQWHPPPQPRTNRVWSFLDFVWEWKLIHNVFFQQEL